MPGTAYADRAAQLAKGLHQARAGTGLLLGQGAEGGAHGVGGAMPAPKPGSAVHAAANP